MIGKWLNAGVLEDGEIFHPETGTPQGGVISPLLANVFLHYVLDVWFAQEVQPRLHDRAFLIRYADDFVMGFTCEEDARRVWEVLPQRFGKFGLTIHPDKTRLLPFQRPTTRATGKGQEPSGSRLNRNGGGRPGSFDFLGSTHYWGCSRKGLWIVKRKTAATRMRRTLQAFSAWCQLHRHDPVSTQQQVLNQKLRGHDAYYGVTGNAACLDALRYWVRRIWRSWLARRNRERRMPWSTLQTPCSGNIRWRRFAWSTRSTGSRHVGNSDLRNRMGENACTYGSVGTLGGQPPRVTRKFFSRVRRRHVARGVSPRCYTTNPAGLPGGSFGSLLPRGSPASTECRRLARRIVPFFAIQRQPTSTELQPCPAGKQCAAVL